MRETIVILKIRDDRNDRPWWQALKLPSPDHWTDEETFDEHVYAVPVIEFDRTLTPEPTLEEIHAFDENTITGSFEGGDGDTVGEIED